MQIPLSSGPWGCWIPSQATQGEGGVTPRTSRQFIAGPQRDKQPFVVHSHRQARHCWKEKWNFALTRLNERQTTSVCCAQQVLCINYQSHYYHPVVICGINCQIFFFFSKSCTWKTICTCTIRTLNNDKADPLRWRYEGCNSHTGKITQSSFTAFEEEEDDLYWSHGGGIRLHEDVDRGLSDGTGEMFGGSRA